jgi:hypothetical protein
MNHRLTKALAAAGTLLVLAAVGCTDTTVQPKSTVTSSNIFNDPSSYQAFLARIYAGLAVSGQQGPSGNADIQGIDEGFSQYLRLYWEHEELPTDAAVIGWGDIGLPEMNLMTWTSSSTMVVAMYYRIFVQAAMANEFLRQTTDAALASRNVSAPLKATIQTYRAEARFLRALSYWHGLDLFGSIPLVTENDAVGSAPPPQASRVALYTYVVSELNAIRTALPAPSPATYGRATTGAADMLLAELYLNAGVYTGTTAYAQALTSASNAIAGGYTLDPSYRHLFQADNNTSPEIIFPVTFDGTHTQTWGGVTFLIHAACGGSSMSAADYGMDYCWGGYRLKPETYNLFTAGDGRASFFYTTGQTVAITAISDFTKGIAAPKFSNKTSTGAVGSNPTFPDTDFPMFRLGEAYLIYAEAHVRGGGGTDALTLQYMNALRTRAYGNTTTNFTSIAQVTTDTILAERGRELLFEAHRRTDLIRFGKFTGGTYIWSWKGGTQAGAATDAHYDLYPLPATELVANPNLTQNPGY